MFYITQHGCFFGIISFKNNVFIYPLSWKNYCGPSDQQQVFLCIVSISLNWIFFYSWLLIHYLEIHYSCSHWVGRLFANQRSSKCDEWIYTMTIYKYSVGNLSTVCQGMIQRNALYRSILTKEIHVQYLLKSVWFISVPVQYLMRAALSLVSDVVVTRMTAVTVLLFMCIFDAAFYLITPAL